jgi:hypothetical protein
MFSFAAKKSVDYTRISEMEAKSREVTLLTTGFFANPLTELAGGSATGASDEENTGPKLQLSLATQFAGSVSGADEFAATLSQFEIQTI